MIGRMFDLTVLLKRRLRMPNTIDMLAFVVNLERHSDSKTDYHFKSGQRKPKTDLKALPRGKKKTPKALIARTSSLRAR